MGEWQPFDTVPFDDLVLIWDGFDVCIAKRIRGEWISFGCDGAAVRLMDDFGTSYQEPGNPTHWMPLPKPPPTADKIATDLANWEFKMRKSSTIVISDFLQTVRSGMWTPFEAATALKAALKKEGFVILPRDAALEMMQPVISRDIANWENEK